MRKYLDKCQQNYGDMEDDSYLFSNLGHHLLKSGRTELFPDIFLDLKYVEACLNSTSYTSVDLLNDYSRYGEHIMGKVKLLPYLCKTNPNRKLRDKT